MDLSNVKPNIRYLKDMKEVIYNKEWLKTALDDLELYYMYRGIERKNGMRYDITVIPARMMGEEFVKTKGHCHPEKETYIVLEGKVIFLMQKSKGEIVEDVYAIKAKKNDAVIIPSNYEHIAINPSNQELKIGNWVSEKSGHNYDLLQKMKGACYFYTKKGWIKNKNYKKIPKLRASGETGRRAAFRAL